MYCCHRCGSQIVNGNFVNGGAANTTRNNCPNNGGNGHNMTPIGMFEFMFVSFCVSAFWLSKLRKKIRKNRNNKIQNTKYKYKICN